MKRLHKAIFSLTKKNAYYSLLTPKNTLKKKYYQKNTSISIKVNFPIILLTIFILSTSFLFFDKIFFHKFVFKNKISKFFIPNTYRIAFVFGTRPEALKLFPLIKELKQNKNFVCIIINTGQHKEMLKQILYSINLDNSIDFNLNLIKIINLYNN